MDRLIQCFASGENALAALVTTGVVLLLLCCLECMTSPTADKDDIFRDRTV